MISCSDHWNSPLSSFTSVYLYSIKASVWLGLTKSQPSPKPTFWSLKPVNLLFYIAKGPCQCNWIKGFWDGRLCCVILVQFSSVQFSRSVVSDSLRPCESQHARPSCPSPTPGVHSDSCPLSQWCHPAISSSVVPFSSFPQSLLASESFPMSQLFAWGGQSTGVSASASFLGPM